MVPVIICILFFESEQKGENLFFIRINNINKQLDNRYSPKGSYGLSGYINITYGTTGLNKPTNI